MTYEGQTAVANWVRDNRAVLAPLIQAFNSNGVKPVRSRMRFEPQRERKE